MPGRKKYLCSAILTSLERGTADVGRGIHSHVGAFKRYLVRRSLGRSPLWNGRGGQNSLPIQCARNEPVRSNPPLKGRRKRLWRRRRFCGLKIAAHPNPIPPLAAAEADRILGLRWAFILHCVSPPPPPTDPSLAAAHPSPNDTSLDTGGFGAGSRGTPYGFPYLPKKRKQRGFPEIIPPFYARRKEGEKPRKAPNFDWGKKGGEGSDDYRANELSRATRDGFFYTHPSRKAGSKQTPREGEGEIAAA